MSEQKPDVEDGDKFAESEVKVPVEPTNDENPIKTKECFVVLNDLNETDSSLKDGVIQQDPINEFITLDEAGDDGDIVENKESVSEDIADEDLVTLDEVTEVEKKDGSLVLDVKKREVDSDATSDKHSVSIEEEKQIEANEDTIDLSHETERDSASLENDSKIETDADPENDSEAVEHPYSYLIDSLNPTPEQMQITEVKPPKSMEETPLCEVSSKESLVRTVQVLSKQKEIAIDIQFDEKSFKGYVCFIEISTSESDYIIDAIKLKSHLLLLTEIFINPKIVKIFNKADIALNWLQGQLRLFVVNIFDITFAAKRLGEDYSIFMTLQKEFNVRRRKIPVLDYSVRPVTDAMKRYIRTLPHYLLPIYQDYKNKLLEKGVEEYKSFLNDCNAICKHCCRERKWDGSETMIAQLKQHQKCQLMVMKRLCAWRKKQAEKLNRNADNCMNAHIVKIIAINLPGTKFDLQLLPNVSASQAVMKGLDEILDIIHKAKLHFKLKLTKGEIREAAQREAGVPTEISNKRKMSPAMGNNNPNKVRRMEFWQNKQGQIQQPHLTRKETTQIIQQLSAMNKTLQKQAQVANHDRFNSPGPSNLMNPLQFNRGPSFQPLSTPIKQDNNLVPLMNSCTNFQMPTMSNTPLSSFAGNSSFGGCNNVPQSPAQSRWSGQSFNKNTSTPVMPNSDDRHLNHQQRRSRQHRSRGEGRNTAPTTPQASALLKRTDLPDFNKFQSNSSKQERFTSGGHNNQQGQFSGAPNNFSTDSNTNVNMEEAILKSALMVLKQNRNNPNMQVMPNEFNQNQGFVAPFQNDGNNKPFDRDLNVIDRRINELQNKLSEYQYGNGRNEGGGGDFRRRF